MNFQDNTVSFRGEILLNLSTSDYEFFVNMYNSLLNNRLYPYPLTDSCKIALKRTYLVREPEKFDSKMTFKTFATILIEKKEGKKKVPVLPFDEGFEEIFNDVVDFEIRNIRILRGQNKGLQKRFYLNYKGCKRLIQFLELSLFLYSLIWIMELLFEINQIFSVLFSY